MSVQFWVCHESACAVLHQSVFGAFSADAQEPELQSSCASEELRDRLGLDCSDGFILELNVVQIHGDLLLLLWTASEELLDEVGENQMPGLQLQAIHCEGFCGSTEPGVEHAVQFSVCNHFFFAPVLWVHALEEVVLKVVGHFLHSAPGDAFANEINERGLGSRERWCRGPSVLVSRSLLVVSIEKIECLQLRGDAVKICGQCLQVVSENGLSVIAELSCKF